MTTSDPIPNAGGGSTLDSLDQLGRSMLAQILGEVAPTAAQAPAAPHGFPLRPQEAGAAPAPEVPGYHLAPASPGTAATAPDRTEPYMIAWPVGGASFPAPPALAAVSAPSPVSDGDFYFLPRATSLAAAPRSGWAFDVEAVRRDFPILHKPVDGKPLVWLDNGATTQKPRAVIEAIGRFYENDNSNVHRAAHHLAARATEAYENARTIVQAFVGASTPEEIVFTRGTTEGINLAASSLGWHLLTPGDDILLSTLEHHANIVPWQMIAARTGAKITPIPIDESGQIVLEEYLRLLSRRTKIVALSHVSNVLGTVLPLAKMIGPAHEVGAKVVIDAAQSIAHVPVNVTALDADVLVFSGHKIYGPTGVGVLYGKRALLEELPPWQGGGNMIDSVSFEKTTYARPPAKFEAGTAILAGAVGLGAALSYVHQVGFERALVHEDELLQEGTRLLRDVPGLRILGTASDKVAVLSFSLAGVSPDDIGRAVTAEGIAIRVGHHCAQPVLRRFGFTSIARASLGMYNTLDELRKLVSVLYRFRR